MRRDFETTKLELWTKGVMDPRRVQQLQLARQKGNYTAGYVLLEPETPLRYMVEAELKRLLEPANVERMLPAGKHLDNRDEIKRRWIEKLETRLALFSEESDNRVLSVQWEGWGEYEKAYLVSEPLFAAVGEPLAKHEIFTSATLASIAPLLKIPPKNVTIYPEIFDWDSHVSVAPLPDNARGSMRNEPLGPAELADIYSAPGRPLTVVLFLSKTQAHNAAKLIARKPGVYLQGADKDTDLGELVEQVRRASETYDPFLDAAPMLITYGGWVGTDIPGDKWLVLGSAPKTPITPVYEARQLRGKTRSAWNDFEKRSLDRLQLQQGLGRALRTPTDNAQIIWPANNAFSELGMSPETGRIVEEP